MQPLLRSFGEKAKGVLVAGVAEDSPAEAAGLQPGDILTSFDGIEITATAPEHMPLFNRVVFATAVGKEVEVSLLRDGTPRSVRLTTEVRSKAEGDDLELKTWGITARDLTRRSALRLGREDTRGVHVTSTAKTGPAANAKPALQAGDIIVSVSGQDTNSLQDLMEASAAVPPSSDRDSLPTLVEFNRQDERFATVVEIGKDAEPFQSSAAERAHWIGIRTQVLTRDLAKALKLSGKKGVRVTQVLPGTVAEKAGFQPGDILLKMDGAIIRAEREKDKAVFDTMIREYPVDESVTFEGERQSEPLTITCPLEVAPQDPSEYESFRDETLEFTARELSRANITELEAGTGVYVQRVERAGWASLAGLAGGDIIKTINGKKVDSLEVLTQQLDDIRDRNDEYVVLHVLRKKNTRFIEIHPIWSNKPATP